MLYKYVFISRGQRISQTLAERRIWLPSQRHPERSLLRHRRQHAPEIRHSPTQPQSLRSRSGDDVGNGEEGQEGEGWSSGQSDREEGRKENWDTDRQLRRPAISKSLYFRNLKRNQPVPLALQIQVQLCSLLSFMSNYVCLMTKSFSLNLLGIPNLCSSQNRFSVKLDGDIAAINIYRRKSVISKTLSMSLGSIQTTGA